MGPNPQNEPQQVIDCYLYFSLSVFKYHEAI